MGRSHAFSNRCCPHFLHLTVALALACAAGSATAQTTIQRPTVAGGGGAAIAGSVQVTGTIGQGIVGSASSGVYQAGLGFWPGGSPSAVDVPGDTPRAAWSFALGPNTPNPFRARTRIAFEIPRSGPVSLAVFDPAGRLMRVLIRGTLAAGPHAVEWDGTDADGRLASSGIYFSVLATQDSRATRILALLR